MQTDLLDAIYPTSLAFAVYGRGAFFRPGRGAAAPAALASGAGLSAWAPAPTHPMASGHRAGQCEAAWWSVLKTAAILMSQPSNVPFAAMAGESRVQNQLAINSISR